MYPRHTLIIIVVTNLRVSVTFMLCMFFNTFKIQKNEIIHTTIGSNGNEVRVLYLSSNSNQLVIFTLSHNFFPLSFFSIYMSTLSTSFPSTDIYWNDSLAFMQSQVFLVAIKTLNKFSLRNLLQNITFVDEYEVRIMFKLIFQVFASELDAILIEVCSTQNFMIIDSPLVVRFLCVDMKTPYFDILWRIDDTLWTSTKPMELIHCPIQLLQQIFTIRFGTLVTDYPRSFLLRKLCNCSTIEDEDLFQSIQNKV